jgi:hypothetical protein
MSEEGDSFEDSEPMIISSSKCCYMRGVSSREVKDNKTRGDKLILICYKIKRRE